MGEEDELEMLLGEIPYATSPLNLHQNHPTEKSNITMYGMYDDDSSHHYKYAAFGSPVGVFSLPSDGSSSSFLSNNNDSLSPTLSQEIPSHRNPHHNGNFGYENSVSDLTLTDLMSKFCITDETDPNRFSSFNCFDYCGRVLSQNPSSYPNRFHFVNHSIYGTNRFNLENFGKYDYSNGVFPEYLLPNLNEFQFGNRSGTNYPSNPYSTPHCTTKDTHVDYSKDHPLIGSDILGDQFKKINTNEERAGINMYNFNMPHNTGTNSNFRGFQGGFGVSSTTRDDSFIIRKEGLNFVKQKEFGRLNPRVCSSLIPPHTYKSLSDVRGYIHMIAKDQDGCRFLQRIFDEGIPEDMRIVFSEIIGHVVELMVDPFGNYLMQKLLEVCNEEHRMEILLMLTENPGQLIRISLNTHGTRVVQKLIETLKTKQQVSLVISALEPGFLALIKDLNGNHVIKQCLQSLTNEDNKFIFVAASKYCVEVATHQHGCCVLQCCVSLLTGKHRENLVKEISANGILLAQDEYGNFVIQFILELEIPSARSSLISQFEGNFVHLSTQKFSSHVVEKCLAVFDKDLRSKIIQELLSAPHFKQLLQDPYANYVIGRALKVSEGSRHYSVLAEAIQCHESILRNCPYSKKILSALRQYRETTTSRKSASPRSF